MKLKVFHINPNIALIGLLFDEVAGLTSDFSKEKQKDVLLVLEEVFVNIASYAYQEEKKKVTALFLRKKNSLKIIFIDSGIPFNPLIRVTEESVTRSGGFGIVFIRKLSDKQSYKHRFNHNILSVSFKKE